MRLSIQTILEAALLLCAGSEYFIAPARGAISIVPMGDSITWGYSIDGVPGGYRDTLARDLAGAGISFQLVGAWDANPSAYLTTSGNAMHDGVRGFKIQDVAASLDGQPYGPIPAYWLSGPPGGSAVYPDVILLGIGTNNLNDPTSQTAGELDALVNQITTERPITQLFVASVPPFYGYPGLNDQAVAYNQQIAGIVQKYDAEGKHVHFVDVYGALDAAKDISSDGFHPNASGYAKIGRAWFETVAPLYALPGDANLDGRVDFTDFNTLALNFGRHGARWEQGDFNGDGVVDLVDLNILVGGFNRLRAAQVAQVDAFRSAHVPEPGLGPGLFVLLALRRRRRS